MSPSRSFFQKYLDKIGLCEKIVSVDAVASGRMEEMAGRRSTKTVEQRRNDFIKACLRSGFTGFELVEILVYWYAWDGATVNGCHQIPASPTRSRKVHEGFNENRS
jgi:hypothetical protein